MFRRFYSFASLVALLNMVGLAGLLGIFVGKGSITKQSLRQIGAIIRGEDLTPMAPNKTATDMTPTTPVPASSMAASSAPIVQSPEDLEILRREAERFNTEMEQRLELTQGVLLKITMQKQELEKEREAIQRDKMAASKKTSPAMRDSEGFRRQVEIFDGLNPKVAMEHLLGIKDPDEAAMILSSLETRKANKIVESAKTGPQQQQMQLILQRVREVAPDKAEPLGKGAGGT